MAGTKAVDTRNSTSEIGMRAEELHLANLDWSHVVEESDDEDRFIESHKWQSDPEAMTHAVLRQLRRDQLTHDAERSLDFQKIPLSENPIGDWISQNQQQMSKFAGQYVAIHARRGIIANGTSFLRVHQQIEESDCAGEVVIDLVAKKRR